MCFIDWSIYLKLICLWRKRAWCLLFLRLEMFLTCNQNRFSAAGSCRVHCTRKISVLLLIRGATLNYSHFRAFMNQWGFLLQTWVPVIRIFILTVFFFFLVGWHFCVLSSQQLHGLKQVRAFYWILASFCFFAVPSRPSREVDWNSPGTVKSTSLCCWGSLNCSHKQRVITAWMEGTSATYCC